MINRLPADVPKSGEIYDITLTSAGMDRRKREIAMFIVDNGEFKGTRLSAVLTADLKEAFIRECNQPVDQLSVRHLGAKANQLRLSAHVDVERMAKNGAGMFFNVDENYKDSNVYVAYHLSNFSYARNPSELEGALAKKEEKFVRKPRAKKTNTTK